MIRSLILALMLTASAFAQFPGQPGNPVGYAAIGPLNATHCGTLPAGGSSWATRTFVSNCTFSTYQTISGNYYEFDSVDFYGTGITGGTTISGSHHIYKGCRFQSNAIQNPNVLVTGSDITFEFDSFTPLASFYTSPPGSVWPSAGAGTNATTQIDNVNSVAVNKGYQFGIRINTGAGPVYLDHSDIWGFGNAFVFQGTGSGTTVGTNNWIHDAAQPSGVTGGDYHTDGGPSYLNGGAGPSNITWIGNTVCTLGNTNSLALQAATSGYNDLYVDSNYWCGDGFTIAFGQPGATSPTNSTFARNTIGTDVMPFYCVLYGNSWTPGAGSVWTGNTISFRAATTWTCSAGGETPLSSWNGQFWVPTNPFNSATDNGSNTHTGLISKSSLNWLPGAVATQAITLTAGNSGNLTVGTVTASSQFSQTNTCPATLANGASCTFTVTYTPTGIGPVPGTLSIATNDPSSPEIVPLLGIDAPAVTPSGPNCQSTATIPPPANAPFSGLIGAGTYVANPEPQNFGSYGCFGLYNPILRVSDGNSSTNACTAQGTSCPSQAHQSMFVNAGDGEDLQWSCFGAGGSCQQAQFVTVNSGNNAIIWDFHGMTTGATVRYTNSNFALKFWEFPTASRVTPKLWYSFSNAAATGNGTVMASYDASQTWPTLPTRTVVYDFTSSINGVPSSAIFQTDPVWVNPSDTKFGTGFSTSSTQNTAIYAAAYTVGSGVSVWNTNTSTVTGDYGTTGAVVCQNCGGPTDPGHFTIHNVKWSRDLTYAIVQVSACGTTCYNNNNPYIWQPGTNKVWVSCTAPYCAGHFLAGGQTIFANEYNTPYWSAVNFGSTTSMRFPPVPNCQASASPTQDSHASWINDNSTDTVPFWQSNTTGASNPVYNACNVAELIALDPPTIGDNKVFRAAHNYGAATSEFSVTNQIASVSPDGKYALMTSPMANSSTYLGQLGDTSGNYPCTVGANCRGDVFVIQTGATPQLAASPFFGFTENSTASGNFPTVPYGMQRIWDSPPLQWPSLNTAAGVFGFSNLDTLLAQDFNQGTLEVMYTLSRTPSWITSNPSDTTCSDQLPTVGGGHGQCYPPSDLNSDGSGSNATWKAWITAIAGHVNTPTYLQTHAHIKYWEIWNEPDATNFWMGSFAQLARLTEDTNCIITGRGVIHQSGNGTATPCTATALDPSAQIVMSSGHASSATVLTYAQNQLYCNATAGIPSYQLPCPNPAAATSAALDIINFHLKPGNAAPTYTVEVAQANYVTLIDAFLRPAELAKPLWDGEMSYAIAGFVAPYTDPDMASSLFPRMYLTDWTLNIVGSAWYTWDNIKAQGAQVIASYQQTNNWLSGSSLNAPCTNVGTVYSCGITHAGVTHLVLWDNSKTCSLGVCTTGNQTVGSQWATYQDMTSASAPIAIVNNTVPVGIKAVILSAGALSSTPAPATALFATVSKNKSVNLNGGTQ